MRETYGRLLPEMRLGDLAGKLIVIEGTDGAGRSTQIDLLKPWLEELGHAVVDTGMTRSPLAGEGIRRAKEGNNLGRVTQALFYATDFVDRLENEIVPALRAGFIVLTDRYIYSLMARAIVRGMDPRWIRSIYSVALKPDAVFYLRLGIDQLLPRVVFSRGFDYWESGMDLYPGHDMFDSFCSYQSALLTEFDRLSAEFNFQMVDASADARTVCAHLQQNILHLLERDSRKNFVSRLYNDYTTAPQPAPYATPQEKTQERAAKPTDTALFAVATPVAAPNTNGNGNGNGHHHAGHPGQ
jgi:dTMP kinase